MLVHLTSTHGGDWVADTVHTIVPHIPSMHETCSAEDVVSDGGTSGLHT